MSDNTQKFIDASVEDLRLEHGPNADVIVQCMSEIMDMPYEANVILIATHQVAKLFCTTLLKADESGEEL